MPASQELSRRDFIKVSVALIGGFIGTAIALPGLVYMFWPSTGKAMDRVWVSLGHLKDYPIGIPTLFQFTRTQVNGWERSGTTYGVFVLRQDEIGVRVFSNICTHLGCHVNWHANVQHYISPCHDGHFDIVGKNISGPPPRPLDEFKARVEAGKLEIQFPPYQRQA